MKTRQDTFVTISANGKTQRLSMVIPRIVNFKHFINQHLVGIFMDSVSRGWWGWGPPSLLAAKLLSRFLIRKI